MLMKTEVKGETEAAISAGVPRSAGRERVFDLLRVWGLLSILLAHVDPPFWLWLVRDFDVPLLVLVSGAVCQLGYRGRPIQLGSYFRKRVVRLLAPVYVFLAVYFLVAEWFAPGRFDRTVMLRSFLLLNGMGYVWIIRVFLLVALATPLLLAMRKRLTAATYLLVLGAVYLFHEFAWAKFAPMANEPGWEVIKFTVFYVLPYGCFFAMGLRWPGMKQSAAWMWAAVSLTIAGVMIAMLGLVSDPGAAAELKYPPRLAYFWFGLGMSHALYAFAMKLPSLGASLEKTIAWISASSLWIYLWHIPGLQAARKICGKFDFGAWQFLFVWMITATIAMGLTYLQQRIVRAIAERRGCSERTSHVLTLLFLN